ncbi:ATP-binding protein [Kitasatospora sp. NPDC002227]|uniref:ATP-binding protein n=1 Tax=Kitasatospora sp. NPDC002227 TaxID=3154773 RepID=UPI00332EC3B1
MINSKVAVDRAESASDARTYWLSCRQQSVGAARGLLREALASSGSDDEAVAAGEVVLSELVTNAVLHANVPGRLIMIRFLLEGDALRIEVHDASRQLPVVRSAVDQDQESGRGLRLVEALSSSWGCCQRAGGVGKVVWALVGPVGSES